MGCAWHLDGVTVICGARIRGYAMAITSLYVNHKSSSLQLGVKQRCVSCKLTSFIMANECFLLLGLKVLYPVMMLLIF